jgi:thioredoxin 1
VFSQPGALSAAGLDQLIDGVRALGMDAVRRQLADQATASACQTMTQS